MHEDTLKKEQMDKAHKHHNKLYFWSENDIDVASSDKKLYLTAGRRFVDALDKATPYWSVPAPVEFTED